MSSQIMKRMEDPTRRERAAFEAWSKRSGNGGDLRYYENRDQYMNLLTNAAWLAWKERAAIAQRTAP